MAAGPANPEQSAPKLDVVALQNISQVVTNSMASIQQQLAQELDRVGTNQGMSVSDMVQIQEEMANYTIASQTLSSIMADMTETMKSIVQHMG